MCILWLNDKLLFSKLLWSELNGKSGKFPIAPSCWPTIANKGEGIVSSREAIVSNFTPASQSLAMPNRGVMWATHVVINTVEALQRPKQTGSTEMEGFYAFYLQCYTIKITKIVLWQGLAVLPMLVQSSVVKRC